MMREIVKVTTKGSKIYLPITNGYALHCVAYTTYNIFILTFFNTWY